MLCETAKPTTLKEHADIRSAAILARLATRRTAPSCMLFHGVSGCGKRTAAYLFAKELGIDCTEVGPNDWPRTGDSNSRVIIVNDAHLADQDALGLAVRQPLASTYLILTTSQFVKVSMGVKAHCLPIAFNVPKDVLGSILSSQRDDNGFTVPEGILDSIVNRSQGSIRAALNSLEVCLEAQSASVPLSISLLDPTASQMARLIDSVVSGDLAATALAVDSLLSSVGPEDALSALSDAIANSFDPELSWSGPENSLKKVASEVGSDFLLGAFAPLWNLWISNNITTSAVRMGCLLCAARCRKTISTGQVTAPSAQSLRDIFAS